MRRPAIDIDAICDLHALGWAPVRIAAAMRTTRRVVMSAIRPETSREPVTLVQRLDRQAARRWRCDCGRLATGNTCPDGHDAPWITLDREVAA